MFADDDHESFQNRPADQESVWRYMDLARFLSLLQTSALHLARADQMSDRWEGSYGELNRQLRPELYGEHFEQMFAHADQRRQFSLQGIRLNCWHLSEFESAAMWDIYQGRGVAIRSTWGRLKRSIKPERWINGAEVNYVDYRSSFISERNMFDAFMHKRESFSHEREVKLAMMTELSAPHPTEENTTISLGPEPPVIPVEVDLVGLVERVYVAPDAPEWIMSVVDNVTRRYGFEFPVQQSDLATDPIA
ncbi:hypothetical protein MK786_03085 [Microbacterium sp. CFH 31415]|uniref:hypothetical protein n=1 Tax=Microbacterium sp. CFH 31415 TaxID=2921732 RepID=UPI001F146E0A|nr:hypothetical protein [Microbacterium sp. CFH 31415]MCH6229715.1 hypothetical protein [Microbacterium sp. CFH 31415]